MTIPRYLGRKVVHQDKEGNITIDLIKEIDYEVKECF